MLIAHISDTHISAPDPEEPKFLERIRTLETFVAHINALEEKPDLVLHTGDVTHGGTPEYYAIVHSIMEKLGVPSYFSLGNRDKAANLVAGLGDLGGAKLADGFLIYSIDDFPVRLVAMDTQHSESNMGSTCEKRLKILDEFLKEQPDTPTALFMHHPPFEITTSKYRFQFEDMELAEQLLEVIGRHKQVVHLFGGHAHRHYTYDLVGCHATLVPSLPVDNRLGDFEDGLKDHPLYLMHRWHPDTRSFESALHAADVDKP